MGSSNRSLQSVLYVLEEPHTIVPDLYHMELFKRFRQHRANIQEARIRKIIRSNSLTELPRRVLRFGSCGYLYMCQQS